MAANYGYRYSDRIELDFWLIIADNRGGQQRPGVRVTAAYPELKRNERALNLKMRVPTALFETPTLKATITIADPGESEISLDVPAIAEAVRGAIGMDVDIKVNGGGEENA